MLSTQISNRYCECYSLVELLEPDEMDELDELDELVELDKLVVDERVELCESLEGEEVGEFVGSGLSGGASFSGVGPEGSGHEPEIVIPKILTQGR